MSKKFKIIFLLAILNLGGCSNCKDIPKYFDINGLTADLKQITTVYEDGSFSDEHIDSNAKVNFDKFIIQLTPNTTYYGDNSIFDKFDFSSLFISKAMAKCMNPGYEGSLERISEINIFSSYQFTNSGLTTDTLSKYFDIDGDGYKGSYLKRIDLVTFTKTNPQPLQQIHLILKAKPDGSLKHKFTVQYKQTNGETYTVTTPTIEFNP